MSSPSAGAAVTGVAIVGMSGRFPGAESVDALWANLLAGRETITRFTHEQLSPLVPDALRRHPRYVPARGVIAHADRFDAAFFGIPPREALLMDPQQRVFLELCWNALEDAGVDPGRFTGSIGVYAGTSNNGYRRLVESHAGLVASSGEFATMLANEKDYVATRVAHRLDLTGPALSIHTACSTSLVAVAQAWYALMSWQCDLALAGGINIVVPQESGYLPAEGGMESEDGHCRPFDRDASGTVFSSGGAAVVLKRVEDAIADGDTIYAVIRGVGVNNDGGDKASFTAPSVRGQAEAIAMALSSADVEAASIGYVEAHGTGTPLGDPIEVAALDRVYQQGAAARQSCWLGSAKGNLGHLNAASGVAGLIKAALSLHHGRIPPTLHYRAANPEIDFAHSTFKVVDHLVDWPRQERPRRAGVSSFGVGGTNAHVILEEAPAAPARGLGRRLSLLPLSARNGAALQCRADGLANALARADAPALPDVAYTLALGRQPMPVRGFVVAGDVTQARERLVHLAAHSAPTEPPALVMLFPGQGSQHVGMARELVEHEPVFRDTFERCCVLASAALGEDLRALILPMPGGEDAATRRLAETRYTQPALFAVEYALAGLWSAWGLHPAAMIGHSIGEYVAACRAGVFSLEDAVALVVARGAAMAAQPPGAMLVVRMNADALATRLPEGVEIAGYNAPAQTVLSGTDEAIDALATTLALEDIACTRLRVSHAFHSHLMDGALPLFRRAFEGVTLHPPQQRFYSCVGGLPITAEEATTVDYWCRQLRAPVRFADAVRHALGQGRTLLLEAGPSQVLTGLVRGMLDGQGLAVPSLGPAARAGDAQEQLLRVLGECWCAGMVPDWVAFHAGASCRRVALPGYPFQGKRYWVEPAAEVADTRDMTSVEAILSAPSTYAEELARLPSAMPSPITAAPRSARLAAELRELFGNLCGELLEARHDSDSFLDLGFDSLALTQAALAVEQRYGLKLKFRRLMEDADSIQRLTAMLDVTLPPEEVAPAAADIPAQPATALAPGAIAPNALARLIQGQMALLQQQSALLASLAGQPAVAMPAMPVPGTAPVAAEPAGDEVAPANLKERPFGASARITTERRGELSATQRRWLATFTEAYCQRTARSKTFAQQHRAIMADPRVVTGFNPLWKELTYPITVARSSGARLWDIDGNEYIDLLNGFGVNFLGYQPAFITAALHAQIDTGMEIGPQHPLTAEVAQQISDMTGMQRVAFCNTGSEAVMGAMRVARTVTGRKTIVVFRDSYHGIFDEVIVRGTRMLRSIAAAPGILANAVENVLVLDYGSEDSLRIIRERTHELAAVLVEPVQSRHPTLLPTAFVKALREICTVGGCALIFDEVITGFRMAPGGAQEYYGVRADIATYGKIIGGGLPFAAIAGSARWMDALDGGYWQFGDDSCPEAGVTYFAGTFVRHPLALAAALAALQWISAQGPQLQTSLNARTQAMVARLNALFAERRAPVTAVGYSSLWKLRVDEDQPCASLLWYRLRHAGLHLFEQFNCFLSVAHGEAEVAQIVAAVSVAVDELLAAGVLMPRAKTDNPPPGPDGMCSGGDLPAKVPLTDAQMERWLGAHYNDTIATAFNESMCIEFDGALDADAFGRAFESVVQRHDALAMRFAEDGSGQIWEPPSLIRLEQHDLSGKPDAETAFQDYARAQAGQAFDLARPPLMRAFLVTLSRQRTMFLVIAHHIIMDGWSWRVFSDELAISYSAIRAGKVPQLPQAGSWRRFALLERRRRDGAEGKASLAWWLAGYRNLPEALRLPTDLPRDNVVSFDGDSVELSFDAALVRALGAAARARHATLFAFLLTGFYLLLHRLTGQDDLVCGVPFAGQAVSDDRHSVGDSDNTLPLRMHIDLDDTFETLLQRVRAGLLDASEHQHVSIGRIIGARKVPRDMSRLPLADVFFNLNPTSSRAAAYTGLEHRHRDMPKTHTNWDLAFHFTEREGRLDLLLHYNTRLFTGDTVRRWASHLRTLLGQAAVTTTERIGDLPLLDAGQRGELLEEWNATRHEFDRSQGVTALFDLQARRAPRQVAAECQGERLAYAELDRSTHAVARALAARGIGHGAIVGICMPRGMDMLVAVLGVLRSGAAYLPMDPDFPVERLRYMAAKADVAHVLVTQPGLVPEPVAAGRGLLQVQALAAEISDMPLPRVCGDDLAYVLFTSGSTGQPKGVRILHRNLVNFLQSMQRDPGFGADDALCAVTTLSFDIAGLELYLPLVCGGRVVIATEDERRDPQQIADLVERSGCTVLQTTPSLLRLLLETGRDVALTRLRLLVGGEALPLELANDLAGRCQGLWNLYGPTETTIWSTLARLSPGLTAVPLGRPIANTRIYVLDGRGQPVPPGVIGEIVIAGDGVADGYLGEPELTAQRFVPEPFHSGGGRMYRTGDLGAWRDGVLYFHGRADHQIKIRGFRIEPGDIEAAATRLEGIRECVVVARKLGDNDLRLVLYAVADGAGETLARALREHLRARLPAYMLPQHIEWLDVLPQTPNGKIDRAALPMPAVAPVERGRAGRSEVAITQPAAAPAAPEDRREAYLAAIWRELIGVADVRGIDNFFDIGGHSLLAVKFGARVQRETGVKLNLLEVATGTLSTLAALLPQAPGAAPRSASILGRLRRMLERH
ncbi:non-ribosomal peptide synthetase/type I polyketide synthase [Metallibacterium sp.]|uniref:non-ribosomal peptide synthetase/type I polyketide synthase n=1 Tax=Metallibacterium sp. TaxID=2940281 RepID=UPI00261AEA6B|nr:non-ribosomal peptide synthetase/type I polyketide synthase [Metallibacterium sp.]